MHPAVNDALNALQTFIKADVITGTETSYTYAATIQIMYLVHNHEMRCD